MAYPDRLTPQQVRRVLDLRFYGDTQPTPRVIAGKLNVSRDAVQDCLVRAAQARLIWPLASAELTDEALARLLLPRRSVEQPDAPP